MPRDFIKLRSTTDREKYLERAKEVLDVDQDAKAIDAALRHLVEYDENLREWEELQLTPAQAKALSTSIVSLNYYPQVKTKP